MNSRVVRLLLSLALAMFAGGCKESSTSATTPSANPPAVASAPLASTQRTSAEVTKVVFVDKEHACQCTQKRVNDGWAALQGALAARPTLPIERFHADTQPEAAEPYNKMRAMMALPALYFVDSKGGLVDLLQGEVTQAQIQAVIGNGTTGH
jgi:hypothetical protein